MSAQADDDLYAVLGVSPSATAAEIRAAFRRLAQQHHPDRPAGSAARMAAINHAYAILSNPTRRRQYDAQRRAPSDSDVQRHAPSSSDGQHHAPSSSDAHRAVPPAPDTEAEAAAEPPWRPDLELGRDMEPWRQMYAEERHVWEELLHGQPAEAGRQQIEHALEAARRDELALENAIRQRAGEPPLSHAEFDAEQAAAERSRASAATRAGCLALPLLLFRTR